ncbi:hypothetical protein ACO0LM_02320 [Undibacterium sp. Di26W]|uniref:hypothetical protein n=1 Tax=Undibacterium sp. Di26W TaxID=3413035 RepID=UPI003BF18754
MTKDRRGFHYALDPVLKKTEWEMNDLFQDLAEHNAKVNQQQLKVDSLDQAIASARMELMKQRQHAAIINIDAQRMAHNYLLQIQRQQKEESIQLQELIATRDEVQLKLNEVRKFVDNLEKNKEAVGNEFDQDAAKKEYQLSDDNWLQRMHWRKST